MTRYCFGMVQTELIVFEYEYLFLIPLLFCCCLLCWVRSGDVFLFCFFSGTFGCVSAAQDARLRDQWTMSPLAKCQLQGEANAIDLAR